MLSRRNLMFVLSLVTLAGLQSSAQAETAGAPDAAFAQKMTERMKENLGLTDDQTSQIQSILKEAKTARAAEREVWLKEKKENRTEIQEQINAVLTDEQRAKHEEFMKERQNHRQEFREEWKERRSEWKENRQNKDRKGPGFHRKGRELRDEE